MNKYDDIKTIFSTNMDIQQSCEFLYNYLKNYCFKPYNREKIDSYYNNLPYILKKFLSLISETNINNQNSKIVQSLMQILNLKNSTFKDFDFLLNIFLVPLNFENEINIFSSIFIHNYGSTKFLFPISNSANSNKMILHFLNQNKIETVYNNFKIFKTLLLPKEDIKKYLLRKELILTIKEYYVFIILNFIKKSTNINKLNIRDYYPNFKKFFECVSQSNLFSKKTELIINNFDKEKSLTFNFYSILFLDFTLFLHFTSNYQNQRILELLTFAIEFLWLGDYVLYPQSDFYLNYNLEKFDNESQNFSKSFISNKYSIPNYDKNPELISNFSNSNLNIPNLLVLNCLKNLINILQSKNYLFTETIINGEKKYIMKQNIMLFSLQNPLFNLFKNCFIKLSKPEQRIYPEISLSDIARVWFSYISPWESPFNCNGLKDNKYNQKEKRFGFFSWNFSKESDEDVNNFIHDYHNNYNIKKNVSLLKNIFNSSLIYLKQNTQIIEYSQYVEINLHFYTDLLNDYLNAFTSCNILSLEEIGILINVLEMYSINFNGFFINEFINYDTLREYSNGNINVIILFLKKIIFYFKQLILEF